MSMVALRVVRSTLPLALLGHGALDGAGADACPPAGHEAGQDEPADGPGQVDSGAGEDAGGEDDLLRAALRATEKLARSGSAPGAVPAASAIAVRSPGR